ncbi:hypothetical protein AB0758_46690 [Tolypothrix bouteillei VB521301_2]
MFFLHTVVVLVRARLNPLVELRFGFLEVRSYEFLTNWSHLLQAEQGYICTSVGS